MRVLASVLVFAVVATALAPIAVRGDRADPPRLSYGPQDLWTQVVPFGGWGFGPANITDPGPTIPVNAGESVTLNLFATDLIGHRFLLDTDNSGDFTPGEIQSATFSSSTTGLVFTFTNPTTPGTFQYICGIHLTAQRGVWVIRPAGNQPPTIALTNPDGIATNRWTGGSLHRLTWNANDPDGLPSQLSIYLNYSYNGGANTGVIAGPLLGVPSFDWTVPPINANDVHVLAEAVDPLGAKGSDDNTIPVIDSTPPAVTATVPANGAVGVSTTTPLDITFSEAMNQASAQGATSLCRMPGCVAVPIGFVSWTANTLRMQPSSTLAADTVYQGTVSTAARDDSNPGNGMTAPSVWSFRTANTPPGITVSSPTSTSRWTGGSTHTLAWTATDAEDPPGSLTVWLNYSATGSAPWTAIAGPIAGTTTSMPWAVPGDDTGVARIEVTAIDTGGAKTVVQSPAFSVDSTAPTVQSTNPSTGATGVPPTANMVITFSEPMNTGATASPAVVALQDVGTSAWLPLSFSWDGPAMTLTANPLSVLVPLTAYRLYVNASARDGADPGLTMASGLTVDFTTSSAPDTTPPTITSVLAVPSTQTSGGSVDISATVMDDVGVALVAVNLTLPDSSNQNLTMSASGSRWSIARTWTLVGSYPFVIWAVDTSGNADSAAGSFTIVALDTTPPEIQHTSPGSVPVGQAIAIRATVTDDDAVAAVWLVYTDIDGNVHNETMVLQGGQYVFTIPAPTGAGAIHYRIWAADPSGNVNVTLEYALSIQGGRAADYTPIIAILILLVAIAVIALTVLMRRRKKGESKPPDEPEPL